LVSLYLGEHLSSATASQKPDAVAAGDLIVSGYLTKNAMDPGTLIKFKIINQNYSNF
jgi:hypothetical protein